MTHVRSLSVMAVLVFAACAEPPVTPTPSLNVDPRMAAVATDAVQALGDAANLALANQGSNVRADYAEWIGADEAGQQVFFNNRGNKQLGADFIPGDVNRDGRTNITYITDQVDGSADLTLAQTNAAIDAAMTTWNNQTCSAPIPVDALPNVGDDLGVVEFLNGLGGSPFWLADITHAGWFPGGILPPNVLGVTFTFIWVDGNGDPTDLDGNGKADVAFREIYYNDAFTWNVNGASFDVETVALHEAGHGLSQGHFGKAFRTLSNGVLHFSPRAVMNAAYSGVQHELAGSDVAGHCSNWAGWPNN